MQRFWEQRPAASRRIPITNSGDCLFPRQKTHHGITITLVPVQVFVSAVFTLWLSLNSHLATRTMLEITTEVNLDLNPLRDLSKFIELGVF